MVKKKIDKNKNSLKKSFTVVIDPGHGGQDPGAIGTNGTFDFTSGATHYHTINVYPEWADTKTRTTRIEDHIFYRWESKEKQ